MTLAEKRAALATKSAELKKFTDDNPLDTMTADQVAEFRRRNDELTPLHEDVEKSVADAEAEKKNGERLEWLNKPANASDPPMPGAKSGAPVAERKAPVDAWSEKLDKSDEMKELRSGMRSKTQFEMSQREFKNIVALTDWNNEPTRLPNLVPSAQEERTVRDLALQGRTDNNAITYMEETTFTNNTATVAEAAAKPESALDFTKRTVLVEKIATWIQTTKEMLDDIPAFNSYVQARLQFMVKRHEEVQLLTGNGTSPQIRGYLNATGIQTQAKGADSVPDAIYKGITLVRNTGFAEPNAVVMHPNDWQVVRLLTTVDGVYIWGPPMDAGPERIWGLPVRVTTAETENTALVGAFTPMSQVFEREGITVTVSTEHASTFVSNVVTILAEERIALAIYRGAAFCKVTGI